jgi:hypothetical protein
MLLTCRRSSLKLQRDKVKQYRKKARLSRRCLRRAQR